MKRGSDLKDVDLEGGADDSALRTIENSAAPMKGHIEMSDVKDKQEGGPQEENRVSLPILNVDQLDIDEAVNSIAFKKADQRNMQSIIAMEEKVNYLELMAHIQSHHPTVEIPVENPEGDDKEPLNPFRYFYLSEPLGDLAPKIPCKKYEDEKGKSLIITTMAQQLGLGPSLFLMTTKAFAWFFLALTIINIPVLIFFGTGNSAGSLERPTDLFAILSMGNVGQSGLACNSINVQNLYQKDPSALGYNAKEQLKEWDRTAKININCGIGSRIKGLVQIGLSQNKTSSCKGIYDQPTEYAGFFKSDCSYHNSSSNNLFDYETKAVARKSVADAWSSASFDKENKKEAKILENEMDCMKNYTGDKLDFASVWFNCHCVNRSSCRIPGLTNSPKYTYLWDQDSSNSQTVQEGKFVFFKPQNWLGYQIKSKCYDTMKAESVLKKETPQMLALASCISPKIENPFTGNEWTKDKLGVLIVFFDIATVVAIILFTKALISTQEDYVHAFDLATIQMTDFTVRVQNLPHNLMYGNKDDILRAMLTAHFQEILRDEMHIKKQEAKFMSSNEDDFDNLTTIDPVLGPDRLEALDFEIADINFGKGDMTDMNYLMKMADLQNKQTRNQIRVSMLPADSSSMCGGDKKTEYEKEEALLNYEFEKVRDLYLEDIKQEKKTDFNEEERVAELQTDPDVRYAYITFRSMDAVDLVKSSYKRYGPCQRFCIMRCHESCCRESRAELKKKYICQQYPKITNAVTPDMINWQNLGYGNKYRSMMTLVNWCIAIALIVLSLIFIIILKQKTLELKKEFNINVVCPKESTTEEFKKVAWTDQQLNQTERLGLMHCYCFNTLIKNGTSVRNIKFKEFQKYNETSKKEEPDQTLYCKDWFFNYASQQSAVIFTSLVVVIINIIASIVLTLSVTIEKNHTVNDETMGQFMKLTILQFINIGVIILIINFDFTETDEDGTKKLFLGFLPIFNGQFKDFNSEWYSQVGKTLTLTLLLNIFTPHISKLTIPFLKVFKRCCDRGCSKTIWKNKSNEQDIDVNTKLVLQSDVNLLYTGDQIASHYVYAQNYTYLCVVLMYSSGLPLLYPFAALFYCVLYWVYKGLLLKYYARTTKFNEEIPIQSMAWVKFGLVMHLFIGSIMLSNQAFFPKSQDEDFLDNSKFKDVVQTDKYKEGMAKFDAQLNELDVPKSGFFVSAYFERLESGSQSTIYLTFIVLLFIGWLTINILGILLNFFSCLRGPILKCLSCFSCCRRKLPEVKSKDIYKEYDVLSLESMLNKAREDLSDFQKTIDSMTKEGQAISYKENRFEEEIDFDNNSITEIYERRIKQIDLVCNDHLTHLHGLENLNEHFIHLNSDQKLRYLLDKQQLVHKDERMRMVDITQSYNIYDSIAFKTTKTVQENIESNPAYNLVSKN